jgi:hypothetical protein
MGIEERLRRLEAERGRKLCEERYCMRAPTFVEIIHYPDGSEERLGKGPPPLCASCPERSNPTPRVRHVEVVLARRGLHGSERG